MLSIFKLGSFWSLWKKLNSVCELSNFVHAVSDKLAKDVFKIVSTYASVMVTPSIEILSGGGKVATRWLKSLFVLNRKAIRAHVL